MLALYSFGESLEKIYEVPFLFGTSAKIVYLLLYVTALIVASVPDFLNTKQLLLSLPGCIRCCSAVIFSAILFNPNAGIGLIFLPGLHIPGYIFAIIYLVISTILAKKGNDNIGHTAHITGAIYGLLFTYIATKLFTNFDILETLYGR